jgi:predicted exporter
MSITGIYDFLARHKWVRRVSLILMTALLAGLVLTIRFSEDISDFLPLGTTEREHMSVYQNISGAEDLYILFSNPGDADRTVEAIDAFEEAVHATDTEHWCDDLSCHYDVDSFLELSAFVQENVPYFLTEADYARMDSLLAEPGYIPSRLAADREMLMFPSSGLFAGSLSRDPLGLFSPVLQRLQRASGSFGFSLVDGCAFTPDMSRAVVRMRSPFGSSETSGNARLLGLLGDAVDRMQADYPDVRVDFTGGPAIAVGNSSRIKKDSILAIALSAVLIVLLLVYSFRSLRNILLIFLSVGWGVLFALGGMALFGDRVSIIVIGIASVIIGIAVNYPLHLIAHVGHQNDKRLAIREIVSPLVVGNITTVGAFLALVPLKSTALRDLGLFASLLLVGTIVFVLLYLPHYIAVRRTDERESRALDYLSRLSPERSKVFVGAVVAVTLVLGWFSFRTGFDTDMSHINYMTDTQRADMKYFEDLMSRNESGSAKRVYVYSEGTTMDAALEANAAVATRIDSLVGKGTATPQNAVSEMMVSRGEQTLRLARWNAFVERHQTAFSTGLDAAAKENGFTPGAFAPFKALVDTGRLWEPQEFAWFAPLTETVFRRNFTTLESGKSYMVTALNVEEENVSSVKDAFTGSFDLAGMNADLTRSLSDNFNYIGWACSLIVFFFLWFSFGRLELALISFLPMAVSWVWILGLMALAGVKFNIVNVILATFIFGQGDDYTIFITEGCQYEYAHRRPILASYKRSILQSAAIMLVGIGTLIVARHPAMHSLAEVTIIGMFSVVLMAYLIPPLLFRWITTRRGEVRRYPLTLRSLFAGAPSDPAAQVRGRYLYKGKDIIRVVRQNLRRHGPEVAALQLDGPEVCLTDEGYGELALLAALLHPDQKFTVTLQSPEHRRIATVAADGFVNNVEFIESQPL